MSRQWPAPGLSGFSPVGLSQLNLVTTLELIKAAVLQGELDTAITAASTKLRAGFERRRA
ncbi:MAG: hypothetical protein EBW74_02765 [Betaproteobacteria bacterium]|nr:hypothetical protein [Betaproteobacteria bacterium]